MSASFQVSADGFLKVRDTRKVRTPGRFERHVEAAPEAQAVAFLLSHAFPGHRKVVRRLTEGDRRLIQLARWADSVSERMTMVDRVWRRITEPVPPPRDPRVPRLIQVVAYGDDRAYPLYLDGVVTRVEPHGGVPLDQLGPAETRLDLRSA